MINLLGRPFWVLALATWLLAAADASADPAAASRAPVKAPLPIGAPLKPAHTPPVKPAVHRTSAASWRRGRGRLASGPLATIHRANAAARDWPTAQAYVNSALFYDFEPGRLYTIHASPRFLTTIALKPGEKLISKAAGDTVRWVLGETQSGAGDTTQVIVFVKPIRPDLRTNIVLTTDQHTYLIDAVSGGGVDYTSVLSWNYPQDLARTQAAERARVEVEARVSVASGVAVDRLDFDYRVGPAKGRPPRWTPVRVFDDGAKTFIQFPPSLPTSEAPPLFLVDPKGRAELVNYRVQGLYYVVDRLIDTAELRLGETPQAVVRIVHVGVRP
jgi:P-type conjugative transfer protein TrbG